MNIKGIDEEKCIACKACVEECRRFLFDNTANKVVFSDPDNSCKDCGHCIAICPEDAIVRVDFGDTPVEISAIPKGEATVPYDNMLNLMRKCRSIRHYKPDPVPREILDKVISAMRYAPTGSNARTEKYVIITNPDIQQKMSDNVIQSLLANPGMRASYDLAFKLYALHYNRVTYFDAPHVIIAYSSLDLDIEDTNIGICLTYGRLAAETLNLGTCWNGWTQIALKGNKELQKLTGARGARFGAITLGYPNVKFHRTAPRSLPKVKWVD